jgi:hypothetical protein
MKTAGIRDFKRREGKLEFGQRHCDPRHAASDVLPRAYAKKDTATAVNRGREEKAETTLAL